MTAPRCGVLGSPITHSLSPVLHRAGYAAVGLDWSYDAHEVGEAGLPAFVADLGEEWRGLSLTMPLKRAALPLAVDVSPVARLVGAANTLVRRDDGAWAADNTDVPGLVAALRERGVEEITQATVLGGGTTAASAIVALAGAGCRRFLVAVRNPDRVGETLEAALRFPEPLDIATCALGEPAVGDLVVSTIPADAQTDDVLDGCAWVPVLFDVIYDPWPTPLAESFQGRVVVGGLDLLVHQAALQFTAFTGVHAPLEDMRAAGEAELRARAER